MENKSRYATKFYVVLMMLSLVFQLFVPVLEVAAVEVPTVVTEMTAKSTSENTAELNLSLNNTSSEKKSEQIKLDSGVLMIPGVLETLVSTEGKNVGTYQIKNRQIDVEINENVSAQVNIPVTFSATDTAATATFTNGQLTANVDVAAKQNKTSSSSTSSSEEKVTTSTSTTSSTSITSKSEVSTKATTQAEQANDISSYLPDSSNGTIIDKADTKKSVTKATTQAEQANDISSYLPDSSNGTIIDKADIKFTDPSNNEVSAADVTADTNVSLAYNWSIPNELKDGYSVKAGDYFEFKLPANITYRAGTGDLGDYGTYEIKSDGTVRFTFNSNVDDKENIKGTFNYNQAKINVTEPGQTTIIVPIISGDQKVDIIVNPTGGNDIAKSGTVSPAKNPQSVNWQVDINTNGRTLNNAVIKDTLPKGLKLTGTQVYLLNINLKGNITGEGQQLTQKTDYTVSDNGTVTLIGNYSKTQQAFRIKYATDIEADAIPNEGGDVKFENNATLVNNGKDYPAQATVTASYGKLLDKKYDGASGSQKLNWTINYNAGDKKLPAGTVLTDNLSGAQEYTGTPKIVYTDGPNSGQEVKQADYEITYNSAKTQMTIKFTNGLEQAVKITYQTQVNTPINGSTTIKNSAESDGKKVEVGDIKVAEQGIVKSLGAVDYNAKTVAWNVKINHGQQEMTNWSAEDTIPNGLTLVDDTSFVLKDVTTNKALVRGTDYQFTKTATGFKIELSGAYNKTSDEFLLTYKTNFDTKKLISNKWTNTIAAAWTDKNGVPHQNNGSADFIPKKEFVTDGTKSGSYNAVNKHITWTVVANYNQRELKNAKLVDILTGDPEYVTDSAKLYEATINPNGSYTLGKQVDTNIDYAKDSRTLTANLPENSNKAYVMIFETSLEGKVIDAPSYDNTAKYTNDGQDKDLTAKVSVPNSGKVAYKTGEQDPGDSAYAVWNITVNPGQSTLKDVTVVDKPSTNQVLDKSDVVVYGTKIATNGAITVDKDSVLTEGKDYSIDITTDQTSGEQIMTIKFLHEISTAYSVHYRTLINSSKINDTLSNTVTVTGTGAKVVTGEVTTSHDVVNNSGTAEGTNLDYQLTKVDKDTDKVLSGVKFELWSYKNNAKGQLLRTGTTDDKGQIRWNNLKSGKYVLVETAPTDYQTVTDRIITLKAADANSDKLVTSTITNEKVKTSVSGEKTWVDNNDQDGVRPDEITVNLLADGKKIDSKTVTAKDGWKYEFNDLDKFKAGQEIKYTVEEAAVAGYETTYDGNNIVNTHQVAKTSVSGQKTWSDHDNQDGVRPDEITVNLLADGKKIDSKTVTAKDGWKYEFNDLDKFKAGQEIKYTVEEAAVAGYETTYDGNNIVNTHQVAKTSVSGQKTWLDNNDQDGNRPDSITLHLLANGKEVATKAVTAKDDWKYEFNDLDEYSAGKKIVYTITEDQVNDYNSDVSDAKNIVNKYTPGKTSATVTKAWQDADNQDGLRTSIKVQLYANDKAYGDPVELTSDTGWTYTWNDLNQRQNHKDVKYTVKEVNTPDGYVAEVNSEDQGNLIITNTHKVAKTSVSGQKTWSDHDNQDGVRPDEITVNLLADGKKVDSKTVTAKDGWKYEFNDLDKFKAGQPIKYTVDEAAVDGYKTTYDGNNITNTHEVEKTSVSGQKTWSDHDNQDGVRPDEITVNLLADGKKVDSKTVTAKDGWKYEFNDLDKFKAGQPIKYTVDEAAVDGYKTTYDGNNITNTHEVEKTSVSGQKTWSDHDNQDGVRPDEITVNLLADGKKVDSKTVTAKDGWKYEFNDLDKFKAGQEIKYTVEEAAVAGYETTYDGNNIVNTHQVAKTSVSGQKTWSDHDNQDGVRPDEITVNLLADGKKIDSKTVTAKDGWKYEFNDLDKFKAGQEIKYTVEEAAVAGYETTYDGNNIVNTHQVAKTSVSGQKTWSDHDNQDGVRPDEITVNLLADGKKIDSKTVTAKDGWKYEFNDLDKFKAGQEIKYTVEEAAVAGYETTYDGNNIVNTHQVAKTSVSGQKTWLDNNDQDGNRPDSITLHLLANGKEVATKAVTAKDDWKYEFNDLDEYSAGKKIVYTITEDQVNDYNSDVSDAKNIVNKYTPGKTSATVTKAWQDADNQDGLRTSIKVQLYANDKAYGDPVELTSDTGWTYTWNDLNQRQNHKDVKYTVKEVNTPDGYVAEVNSEDQGNLIITNTHKVAKTSVSGQKTWSDHDNQDGVRPDEITVNLLADGKKVDSKTVTAKDGWKYEFNDLDKFKAGQPIKYTVDEAAVDGYKTTYDGNNITNTHEVEKTSVSGQKTWSDHDNQDGVRPDEITVNLLADGKKVDSKTVTAKDGWKYEFNDLDKFKAGQPIKYTVDEAAVDGYKTTYDGNNITNTHEVEKTSVSGQKTWSDHDNQDGVRPDEITVNLLADGKKVDSKTVTAKDGWKYEFNDLDKFKAGQEIKYTVEEAAVAGYETTYDGNNIVNTHQVAKTSVSGQKTWSDHDNQDGVRPDEITVNLLADGKKIDSKTVTAKDGWKYEFNDLDKFKAGQEIKYTVEEAAVAGYETTYDGNNIVNTHQVAKTSVSGQKTWSDHDNQDGVRPDEITVNLLADGKKIDSKTVTAKDGWKYEFNDLDKFKAGQEIKYTVEEAAVAGYETTYDGNNIVNTHQVAKTSVSGQKTWSDHDNQDGIRPSSITVNLLANGQQVASKKVSASDNWQYSFDNLAAYANGQKITYTVTEDAVAGYTSTIDGYNVTNNHTPATVKVSGTKTWNDNNNQDGIRPSSITVNLLANGQQVASKKVSASDNWQYSFDNLAAYANGQKITYTVTEDAVAGYTSTIDGYNITNTNNPTTPKKPQVPNNGNKVVPKDFTQGKTYDKTSRLPQTGDRSSIGMMFVGLVMLLLSLGLVVINRFTI